MRRAVMALVAGVALGAAPVTVLAQMTGAAVEAPVAVVRELMDAMRAGDSARVRAVFHPRMVALMSADVGPDGQARVSATPVDAFVRTIGTPHPEVYDERLSNPRTLVDGTLASVWVDYAFYVGTKFSHCGVDVVHVAKVGAAWRIIALSDTRRTEGCSR